MRILPQSQRDAMYEIYSFCRRVDDIADSNGPRPERLAQLNDWRAQVQTLYQDRREGSLIAGLAQPVRDFDLAHEDFLAVIDGMEMDTVGDIRAPDWATLDLYCDRVASAVGRLSVRVFGIEREDGKLLSHHLGRALQLTNILRDLDEDAGVGRLYLPARRSHAAGIETTDPVTALRSPTLAQVCGELVAKARTHFVDADAIMRALAAQRRARAADHGRSLPFDPRRHGGARLGCAAPARAALARTARLDPAALRDRLMPGTIHIIGAGLAGLAAAVELTTRGRSVVVHEATANAGGRCRSYHDRSVGMVIDNGNHLLLSGNHSALSYLRAIGAPTAWSGRRTRNSRSSISPTARSGRCASTTAACRGGSSTRASACPTPARSTICRSRACCGHRATRRSAKSIRFSGAVYERLLRPLLLAALNIDPAAGSAALAGAVMRETIAAGGQACRPLIAREGLEPDR